MDRAIDPRPARRRRFFFMGVGAAVLAVLGVIWLSGFSTKRTRIGRDRVSIGTVEHQPFKEYIPVTANVLPIRTVLIDALEGGTIEAVYAEDGKDIAKDAPILKLS